MLQPDKEKQYIQPSIINFKAANWDEVHVCQLGYAQTHLNLDCDFLNLIDFILETESEIQQILLTKKKCIVFLIILL